MSSISGASAASTKRREKRPSTRATSAETGVYFGEQGLPNPQETVYKPRQRRQNRQIRALQQQQQQQPRIPAVWPYASVQQTQVQVAAEQLIALATQQEQELTEYNKRLRTMEDRVRILVNTASTMMTETYNLTALRDRLEKAHLDLCASVQAVTYAPCEQYTADVPTYDEQPCTTHQQQQQHQYQPSPDQANTSGQCSEEEYTLMRYDSAVQPQQPHIVSSDPNYIPFSMGFYDKTTNGVRCGQQQQQPKTILSTAAQLLRTSCNT